MRTRLSRVCPHGKQQSPGGITLPSPNTQTIIQIIDIYWGKMKEKKLHVHADRWVNVVWLRIMSRFRFLTSWSEWMERLLLNIRKMEEGFNLSQIGYWVWRAFSSNSAMANRHILKQCITEISQITPATIFGCYGHGDWYHSEHFGNAPVLLEYLCRVHCEYLFSCPILSRSSAGWLGVVLSRVPQSVHANFR